MNLYYFLFFLVGVAAVNFTGLENAQNILVVTAGIGIPALITSLLIPFAAVAKNERWQGVCLQYILLPILGSSTAVARHIGGWISLTIVAPVVGMHLAFWTTSVYSRAYRLSLYRFGGFGTSMPNMSRLIAVLSAQGDSYIADAVVMAVLTGQEFPKDQFQEVTVPSKYHGLFSLVPDEFTRKTDSSQSFSKGGNGARAGRT